MMWAVVRVVCTRCVRKYVYLRQVCVECVMYEEEVCLCCMQWSCYVWCEKICEKECGVCNLRGVRGRLM